MSSPSFGPQSRPEANTPAGTGRRARGGVPDGADGESTKLSDLLGRWTPLPSLREMESIVLPSSVGWTALNTAVHRARESQRTGALFDDPFSVALVKTVTTGDTGTAPPVADTDEPDEGTRVFGDYVPLRTHFIDDCLATAIEEEITQAVALGAGLDGRAYRLACPASARVFELDTAEMLKFKQTVATRTEMTPRVELTPVPGDLTADWPTALADAGFDARRPTAWLIEGLLGYLTPAENDRLLARISQLSAPGSRLVAVYADGDPLTVLKLAGDGGDQVTNFLGQMVTVGPGALPEPWLAGYGWDVTTATIRDWAQRTGRPIPLAMDPARGGVECWLVSARRTA